MFSGFGRLGEGAGRDNAGGGNGQYGEGEGRGEFGAARERSGGRSRGGAIRGHARGRRGTGTLGEESERDHRAILPCFFFFVRHAAIVFLGHKALARVEPINEVFLDSDGLRPVGRVLLKVGRRRRRRIPASGREVDTCTGEPSRERRRRLEAGEDVEAACVPAAGDVPVADAGGRRQGRQPLLHPRRGGRRRQFVPHPFPTFELLEIASTRPLLLISSVTRMAHRCWLISKSCLVACSPS